MWHISSSTTYPVGDHSTPSNSSTGVFPIGVSGIHPGPSSATSLIHRRCCCRAASTIRGAAATTTAGPAAQPLNTPLALRKHCLANISEGCSRQVRIVDKKIQLRCCFFFDHDHTPSPYTYPSSDMCGIFAYLNHEVRDLFAVDLAYTSGHTPNTCTHFPSISANCFLLRCVFICCFNVGCVCPHVNSKLLSGGRVLCVLNLLAARYVEIYPNLVHLNVSVDK